LPVDQVRRLVQAGHVRLFGRPAGQAHGILDARRRRQVVRARAGHLAGDLDADW
jgi:hypothetical protein